MRRMLSLLSDKKVRFLVCSNVAQDEKALAEFDHSTGLAHPVQDMYALAGCDYLIAPPSTFSGWSSYYGNVPLFRMRIKNPEFSLESFDVYGKR